MVYILAGHLSIIVTSGGPEGDHYSHCIGVEHPRLMLKYKSHKKLSWSFAIDERVFFHTI